MFVLATLEAILGLSLDHSPAFGTILVLSDVLCLLALRCALAWCARGSGLGALAWSLLDGLITSFASRGSGIC